MIGKTLKYTTERKIGHIVKEMNEHTILKYQPEPVIIDYVKNFWLKNFSNDTLKLMPLSEVEQHARNTFHMNYPEKEDKIAYSFADDTIFHLAFKLTHQGKEVDFVDGTDED